MYPGKDTKHKQMKQRDELAGGGVFLQKESSKSPEMWERKDAPQTILCLLVHQGSSTALAVPTSMEGLRIWPHPLHSAKKD